MKKIIWLCLIITSSILFATGCTEYDGATAEEWADEYYICEDNFDDYEDALEEANNTIEELNSVIGDAQGEAWSDYDDMGDALENMYMLDTVDEPR